MELRRLQVALSAAIVQENLESGAVVGVLTTTDPDNRGELSQGNFSYYLVDEAGAVLAPEVHGPGSNLHPPFQVDAQGRLVTTAVLDFERKSRYKLRVKSVDAGGRSVVEPFFVDVEDVNDAPVQVLISGGMEVAEGAPGAYVGLLSTVDDELKKQKHTYTLVDIDSTDGHMFKITGNMLSLRPEVSADHETNSLLLIRVKSTDNGVPFARSVTTELLLTVSDVNEEPTAVVAVPINASNSEVPRDYLPVKENVIPGSPVGRLLVLDPDHLHQSVHAVGISPVDDSTINLFKCKVIGTPEEATFSVDGNLTLIFVAGSLNFEAEVTAIQVNITCTEVDDGSAHHSVQSTITIVPQNRNERPHGIHIAGRYHSEFRHSDNTLRIRIPESLVLGEPIGTVIIDDPDNCELGRCFPRQEHTVVADGAVNIRGGWMSLGTVLDYETKAKHTANLTVVDNGVPPLEANFMVVLEVVDVNEPPTGVMLRGSGFVDPYAQAGYTIGTLIPIDEDSTNLNNGRHQFELVSVLVRLEKHGDLTPERHPSFRIEDDRLIVARLIDDRTNGDIYQLQLAVADYGIPPLVEHFTVTLVVSSTVPRPIGLTVTPLVPSVAENFNLSLNVDYTELASIDFVYSKTDIEVSSIYTRDQTPQCVVSAIGCTREHMLGCKLDPTFDSFRGVVISGGSYDSDRGSPKQLSLVVRAGATFDFEEAASYSLELNCTADITVQQPTFVTKRISVRVEDENEPPANIRLMTPDGREPSVFQDAEDGYVVGTLVCDDPDPGQHHEFSIVQPTKSATTLPFEVVAGRLVVQVNEDTGVAPLRFVQRPTMMLAINVSDNGHPVKWTVEQIAVRILDSIDNRTPKMLGITLSCGCSKEPCRNGGVCQPMTKSELRFVCLCQHGYSGTRCEIPPGAIRINEARAPGTPESPGLLQRWDPLHCLDIDPATKSSFVVAQLSVVTNPISQPPVGTSVVARYHSDGPGTTFVAVDERTGEISLRASPTQLQAQLPLSSWHELVVIASDDESGSSIEHTFNIRVSVCGGFRFGGCSSVALCRPGQDARPKCVCPDGFVGDGRQCSRSLLAYDQQTWQNPEAHTWKPSTAPSGRADTEPDLNLTQGTNGTLRSTQPQNQTTPSVVAAVEDSAREQVSVVPFSWSTQSPQDHQKTSNESTERTLWVTVWIFGAVILVIILLSVVLAVVKNKLAPNTGGSVLHSADLVSRSVSTTKEPDIRKAVSFVNPAFVDAEIATGRDTPRQPQLWSADRGSPTIDDPGDDEGAGYIFTAADDDGDHEGDDDGGYLQVFD